MGILLALRPLGRSGRLGRVSFFVSAAVNESPFLGFYWVLAATLLAFAQGDLDTPVAWAALALAAVSFIATPVLVRRSLRARPALERALAEGLGAGWRERNRLAAGRAATPSPPLGAHPPDPASLLPPGRRADREYLLRRRRQTQPARRLPAPLAPVRRADPDPPARRQVPQAGGKSFEARPLLIELASAGLDVHQRQLPAAARPRSSPTTSSTSSGSSPGRASTRTSTAPIPPRCSSPAARRAPTSPRSPP